jgi:hypothetical protein
MIGLAATMAKGPKAGAFAGLTVRAVRAEAMSNRFGNILGSPDFARIAIAVFAMILLSGVSAIVAFEHA